MNGKSAKISGPRPPSLTFFSLLRCTTRRFIVWTDEEQREMEADYSGGQSSPWAVAPRGRNIETYISRECNTAVWERSNNFHPRATHRRANPEFKTKNIYILLWFSKSILGLFNVTLSIAKLCAKKLNEINVYKVGNDRGGSDHDLFQVICTAIAWNDWRKPRKPFG
jgi:hypothetical protein